MENADFDTYIKLLPVWGLLVCWGLVVQFATVVTLQWLYGSLLQAAYSASLNPWFRAVECYVILLPNLLC